MNYERYESGAGMWRKNFFANLNKLYLIVSDKQIKDWSNDELRKITEIVKVHDLEFYDLDDLDDKHNLISDITREVVYQVGNAIKSGDWTDYNWVSCDYDFTLKDVVNCALALIENWVSGFDNNSDHKNDLQEIVVNSKVFDKKCSFMVTDWTQDAIIDIYREFEITIIYEDEDNT